MPGPKNYFTDGKYGKYNPYFLTNFVCNIAPMLGLKEDNPKLYSKHENINDLLMNTHVEELEGIKDLKNDRHKLVSPKEHEKTMLSFNKEINRYFKKMLRKPREEMKPFLGVARLLETISDTEKGNFMEAVSDSVYLEKLIVPLHSMFVIGSLHNGQKQTAALLSGPDEMGDTKDSVTGERVPGFLSIFGNYCENVAGLVEREYEKKKLIESYDPVKEAEYKTKLLNNINNIIESVDKLAGYVDGQGNCRFDRFFSDRFASLIGREPLGVQGRSNSRSIRDEIENLKGQKKAIENGWGINELSLLGAICQYHSGLKNHIEEQSRLHEAELAENPLSPEAERIRQEIELVKEYEAKMNLIRTQALEKKVDGPADKTAIYESFNAVLSEAAASDNEYIRVGAGKYTGIVRDAAKYAFRPFYPIDNPEEENINTREDYKNANSAYLAGQTFCSTLLTARGSADDTKLVMDGSAVKTQVENELTPDDVKTGPILNPLMPKKNFTYPDGFVDYMTEYILQKNKASLKLMLKNDEVNTLLSPYMKPQYLCNDIQKGNAMEVLSNNLPLTVIGTWMFVGGPNFDSMTGEKNERILEYLQESGVHRPLTSFFEGVGGMLKNEYYRQNASDKGWNAEKENTYLAGLEASLEKTIKAFDELLKLPDEVQKEGRYYGNPLSDLTGVGAANISRDSFAAVNGLRWTQQAIKNGWSGRDLPLMEFTGNFEGLINKQIYGLEHEGNIEKADRLNRWKEENLKPLKEELFGKKISSPSDVLNVLNKIENLKKAALADQDIALFSQQSFGVVDKVLFKRIEEGCKKDIREGKSLYYGTDKEGIFEKADFSAQMKQNAESIGNMQDMSEEQIRDYAANFIMQKYLDGKNKLVTPELNEKHPDHSAALDKLKEESKRYAGELIDKLKVKDETGRKKLPDNKLIAFALEYGHHDPFMSIMSDRIDAAAAKSRLVGFVDGRPVNKKSDQGPDAVKNLMVKNNFGWTRNTRFAEVTNALILLEDSRKSMAGKLIKQYNERQIPQVDQAKFEEYKRKALKAYKISRSYLDDKNEKIRKAGGDPKKPEDVRRILGERGAKRYAAMSEAKKALKNMYNSAYDFGNKGPDDSQRLIQAHSADSYKIDGTGFLMEAQREKFRRIDNRARDIILEEEKLRIKARYEYEKTKDSDPKSKEKYEAKIFESAMRTLYIESIRAEHTSMANADWLMLTEDGLRGKRPDPASYDSVTETGRKYENALNHLDPAKFEQFKNKLSEAEPEFVEKFKAELFKKSETRFIRHSTVLDIRDKADQNKKLSSLLGTGCTEQLVDGMRKQMKDAAKDGMQRQNVAKQAGKR